MKELRSSEETPAEPLPEPALPTPHVHDVPIHDPANTLRQPVAGGAQPPPRWVTLLEPHLATCVVGLAAFSALKWLPQIRNIMTQLPGLASLKDAGSAPTALIFWAYVVFLAAFFVLNAIWVFIPHESPPSWLERRNMLSRLLLGLYRLLTASARFPLAFPSERHPWRRRLLYGGIFLSSIFLEAMNELKGLPAPWKVGDPGPRTVALLATFVSLLGFLGPKLSSLPRWRIQVELLTRGAVMSLGSYTVSESLWGVLIPKLPEASFRLYTIWAIYHLFFVLLCAARALDMIENTVRRFAFALALLVLVSLGMGVSRHYDSIAPLGLSAGASSQQDAVLLRWLRAANARLDRMCDGPVVFVAAAGGGSRAAIFAMLALESMSQMQVGRTDASPETCHKDSLSNHILFISSVSGGSVASAHFAHCMASGTLSATLPPGRPLKHAPREELEAQLQEGRCGLNKDTLWPLWSKSVDAMFVDFNAPLLRGIVMPGAGRGSSLASFWTDDLGWASSLPDDGSVPLLLINTASARTGLRVVAGKPPLPELLVNDGEQPTEQARSISGLSPSSDIALADAVRASANFPWVVDLPNIVDPKGHREPLIDGGIFDNTGIDTFVLLLRALTDDERWKANADAKVAISRFFERLAERGVLFVEIDSGAKPPPPDEDNAQIGPITTPLSALSHASHAFARTMSEYQKTELHRLLGGKQVTMHQVAYEYGNRQLPPDASEEQKQCFKENQDEVMTAWALGPRDKGRLLGQFLLQEGNVRSLIADHVENLRGTALTRRSVSEKSVQGLLASAPRAPRDQGRAHAVLSLADQMVKDQVWLPQQLGPRIYEDGAPPVQPLPDVVGDAPLLAASIGSGDRSTWVFVGQYLPDKTTWRTCYYRSPTADREKLDPRQLAGALLMSTTPSFLRDGPPDPEARLGRIQGALKAGQRVRVERVEDWEGTGFIWAQVVVAPEQPRPSR